MAGLGCSLPTIQRSSPLTPPLASERTMLREPGSQGCGGLRWAAVGCGELRWAAVGCRGLPWAEHVLAFQLKREPRTMRFCWTTSLPSSLRVCSLWCGGSKLCSAHLNPGIARCLTKPSSPQVSGKGSLTSGCPCDLASGWAVWEAGFFGSGEFGCKFWVAPFQIYSDLLAWYKYAPIMSIHPLIS